MRKSTLTDFYFTLSATFRNALQIENEKSQENELDVDKVGKVSLAKATIFW